MAEIPVDRSLCRELSVGQVAKRSGLAVSAIHFYETQGLIRSSRTGGNQRRYAREILRRVAVIKVAQRIGIPLSIIRDALGTLPRGRAPTAADWRKLSSSWKSVLDERIDKLVRLRGSLNECIGCGCLSLKVCPLRNPLDTLGDEGPGPRLLERCAKSDPKGARAVKAAVSINAASSIQAAGSINAAGGTKVASGVKRGSAGAGE